MGEETRIEKMTAGEIKLLRKIDALERDVHQLRRENNEQASADKQRMHYHTLFGASADKDGLVQKVGRLMLFMKIQIWVFSILGASLIAYLGKILIAALQRGPIAP